MPVLNHHIVPATDSEASASFYIEVLGLGPARKLSQVAVNGFRVACVRRDRVGA